MRSGQSTTDLVTRVEKAVTQALGEQTLRDLIRSSQPRAKS